MWYELICDKGSKTNQYVKAGGFEQGDLVGNG